MKLPILSSLIDGTRDSRTGYMDFKTSRQNFLALVYLAWREGNKPENEYDHSLRIDTLLSRQGVRLRNPKSENLVRRLSYRRILRALLGNSMIPFQTIMIHALEVIHSEFKGRRVSHENLVIFIVENGGVQGLYAQRIK